MRPGVTTSWPQRRGRAAERACPPRSAPTCDVGPVDLIGHRLPGRVEREVVLQPVDHRARRGPGGRVELGDEGVVEFAVMKSGYSSERKRKSKDTQLAPAGTLNGIRSMLTSSARVAAVRAASRRRAAVVELSLPVGLIGLRRVTGREHRVGPTVGREGRHRRVADARGVALGRDRRQRAPRLTCRRPHRPGQRRRVAVGVIAAARRPPPLPACRPRQQRKRHALHLPLIPRPSTPTQIPDPSNDRRPRQLAT